MSQADATNPQLSLAVEDQQMATVVRCSGRLMVNTEDVLRTQVRSLIKPGGRIVLDLTNVTYCDSLGLGAVISLYVSSKSAGCQLELINLGQNVRKLFSVTHLLSLFEVAADGCARIP